MRPGVSIMICCHNGAARLPETIRHIAAQNVPSYVSWEFLLIDNNSTDDSVEVARREWAKYNTVAELRIVPEQNLGLSYARTRGFLSARYEFVIMCDDDNWLDPDYVVNAYRIMIQQPNVAALGGLGKLVFEEQPPRYIEDSNIFAAGPQAPVSGPVPGNKIYGAGCVIRKSAYERLHEVGFKSLLTDRRGRELSSGGDYELCYALRILGYDIWYDDRLKFSHFITHERLNWNYFIRYASESARCFDILSSYDAVAEGSPLKNVPWILVSRNFFYTIRRFVKINLRRLVINRNSDTAKVLFFRHVILQYKLREYFYRFFDMMKVHNHVLGFRAMCTTTTTEFPARKVSLWPALRVIFFSKPS